MSVEYQLLGPLEAWVDGRPVKLGGPKQRAVLVILLSQAATVVQATRIVDDLWGDDPPSSASNLVQGYVSHLRKALGKEAIETRGTGYVAHLAPDDLDLHRFERLAHEGSRALADDNPAAAAERLSEALALWHGSALGDLADEPGIQSLAARLEELRTLALERHLEAQIGCGRHAEVIAAASALVRDHPLRERPRGLLMLALYGCGRQAEALATYRAARDELVSELGIEPGQWLRDLETSMLRHDPALEPAAAGSAATRATSLRSIVVAPLDAAALDAILHQAQALAREPKRELVVVQTIADATELAAATSRLGERRDQLRARGVETRVAVFTSMTPGADLARLTTEHDVDLLLIDAPARLLEDARVLTLLERAPCDVGVLVGGEQSDGPVLVPFAGADHDWAAVELGAWLARNRGVALRLAGASSGADGRDASRLLASASLAVQRALGVPAEPVLVEPSAEALVSEAAQAGIVVVGLTERWRREGLGRARTALAAQTATPTLLVRRGIRPGGLAPRESETRFTWTLAG